MKIFDGKKEADKILKKLKAQIKKEKLSCHLAVVLIGEDKASSLYVNLKKQAAENIGIKFSLYKYSADANEEEIIGQIEKLNKDDAVHGVIVQLPLPKKFDVSKIILAIDPKKDVDGFHPENLSSIKKGKLIIRPVLPNVLFYATQKAHEGSFSRTKVKALVNSEVFADMLKSFFFFENIGMDVLVDGVYSAEKTAEFTKDADILISVLGRPNFIKKEMIKDGAILIDAGITKEGEKVLGDVDFESVKEKAKFVTPVPNGVGPITIAMLLENVVDISRK